MVEKTNWFTGIAVISLLIGIFTITKVAYNFGAYSSMYPGYGALPFSLASVPVYTQTEDDCNSMLSFPPSPGDPAAEDQEYQMKQAAYDKDNCFRSVRQQSNQAKNTDITLAAFFTFLGLGMLVLRKTLPKIF